MSRMFTAVVLAVVIVPASASAAPSFGAWARLHGKEYDASEAERRSLVFAANARVVEELNAQGGTAEFSLDGPFADLTAQEFAKSMLMPPRAAPTLDAGRQLSLDAAAVSAAPTAWDWRDHEAVSAVEDQGSLGTCWAFSAVGNVEGQVALKLKTAPTDLAVEQLVECDNSSDPKNKTGDCGEFGGWPYMAFQYFEKAGGVFRDADMPYCSGIPIGKPGNCLPCMAAGYDKNVCGSYDDDDQIPLYCNRSTTLGQGTAALCGAGASKVGYASGSKVVDWKWISFDEGQIAAALAGTGGGGVNGTRVGSSTGARAFSGGPLSVALNAQLLQFYHKGVFDPKLPCDPAKLDHGVLLVGYGTDAGADYWVVKNSWGSKWGEDGYFRIARGKGTCGINTQVVTALLE